MMEDSSLRKKGCWLTVRAVLSKMWYSNAEMDQICLFPKQCDASLFYYSPNSPTSQVTVLLANRYVERHHCSWCDLMMPPNLGRIMHKYLCHRRRRTLSWSETYRSDEAGLQGSPLRAGRSDASFSWKRGTLPTLRYIPTHSLYLSYRTE